MKEHPAVFYQLDEGEVDVRLVSQGRRKSPRCPIFRLGPNEGTIGLLHRLLYGITPPSSGHLRKLIPQSDFEYIKEVSKRYKRSSTVEELVDAGVLHVVETTTKESAGDTAFLKTF
jgi:hypothetical protein